MKAPILVPRKCAQQGTPDPYMWVIHIENIFTKCINVPSKDENSMNVVLHLDVRAMCRPLKTKATLNSWIFRADAIHLYLDYFLNKFAWKLEFVCL